eukprot:c12017_g1_i1 orf=628-2148(-)
MGTCCSTEQYASATSGAYASDTRMTKKERKRQLTEALAAEAKTNELLARIPGRMCRNGASSSICIFTQQGRKGTNQDAMVAWEDYTARKDTVFCGVFDGHGPYGHLVARRVRDSLPSKLASIWKAKMRGDNAMQDQTERDRRSQSLLCTEDVDDEDDDDEGEDTSKVAMKAEGELFVKWRDSFVEAFEVMDKDLRRHPTIDCFCSGTTAVTLLKQGTDLIIGNVGDSRAVLATRAEDGTLDAVQLTVDLKPSLPKEAERILKCKGRVFALEDEPEVPRVWLPYDDAPGLAMARAFGDFCLKDFGLISVPEVTHRELTPNDQFLVLATDGIWDVLSNKEVVDVVSWAPTRATAARALVETAVRAWRLKYPNSKVDDCAVVCLFLHPPTNVKPVKGAAKYEPSHNEGVQGDARHSEESLEDASFGRSNTVRAPVSNKNEQKGMAAQEEGGQTGRPGVDRSHSVRSIGDCLSTADEDEWSALEGVVRVNSLLKLPRFLKGDKRAGSTAT